MKKKIESQYSIILKGEELYVMKLETLAKTDNADCKLYKLYKKFPNGIGKPMKDFKNGSKVIRFVLWKHLCDCRERKEG